MVAALDWSKASAVKAIDTLLSKSNLPSEQLEATETVLLSLQAVPRLCNLLPPDIPGWDEDEEDEVQGKSPCSIVQSGVPCAALRCPALPCPALPWSCWSSQVSPKCPTTG